MIEATITTQTCGVACWAARGKICHCSCGGKNHGVIAEIQVSGSDLPPAIPIRRRRIGGTTYKLGHIVPAMDRAAPVGTTGWRGADKIASDAYDVFWPTVPKAGLLPHPKVFCQRVAKAAWKKWPETQSYEEIPWLVWVREDVEIFVEDAPTEETDA